MLNIKKKVDIINKYCYHKYDTGSSELQIILFTYRINKINNHFKIHNKDNHGKLGLLRLIWKRKKHLKYLKKNKIFVYLNLIKDLNLKK